MVKCLVFFALAAFCIAGCADTIPLSRNSKPEAVTDAGKRISAGDNCITFRNGLEVTASNLRLTADSVFWQTEDGECHSASCRDIEQISHSDHSRGMLEGIAYGAGVGAGLGLLFAVAASTSSRGGIHTFEPIMAVPVLAAVGFVPGAMIGAVAGHRTVIEYDSSEFPSGIPRPVVRSAAGWVMPGSSDTTHKR